jgi:hypothetical protein
VGNSEKQRPIGKPGGQYCIGLQEVCGPGSAFGIATGYGLDGPGIESQWGRDFLLLSKPALGLTQPPVQWVLGLSFRDADPHPLLVLWSRKDRAIPLLPLWTVQPVQQCTLPFYLYLQEVTWGGART